MSSPQQRQKNDNLTLNPFPFLSSIQKKSTREKRKTASSLFPLRAYCMEVSTHENLKALIRIMHQRHVWCQIAKGNGEQNREADFPIAYNAYALP